MAAYDAQAVLSFGVSSMSAGNLAEPNLQRRRLMFSAAALALIPGVSAGAPTGEAARLTTIFDALHAEGLARSPERIVSLGLDRQPQYAGAKSQLSDRSLAAADRARADLTNDVARLKSIDRANLAGAARNAYDTVLFDRQVSLEGAKRFAYGAVGDPNPYVISQNAGVYRGVPEGLSNATIETADDAEAWLSRLNAFGTALDQDTERFRHDAGLGVLPPDFLFDKTIASLAALAAEASETSPLAAGLAKKTADKGLAGDWSARAKAVLAQTVQPALARQLEALKTARPNAVHEAGVRRLPDGDAYYDWAILSNTTARITADEVHRLGLAQMEEATARADELLKSQGLTQGAVGARIGALNVDPRFLYPETDDGRARLMDRVKGLIAAMDAQMPRMFGRFPKRAVQVRATPAAQEAGAPGAYYSAGSADGARPGYYNINMRLVGASPDWQLPTITFHEANPGHHHQISIAREAGGDVHPILRDMGFTAYSEGWALYAEQLGDELGLYAQDPFGKVGYYRSMMFRAARLVVDSGIHAKGWSREQAIAYLVDNVGMSQRGMTSEVDRYCSWPGQACAYKIGHAKWTTLRERTRKALGDRFDIKAFHDATLAAGAMPLDVLDRFVADWAKAQKT
ncbi:DUF885 domain-containing protein [Caulobacter segnis]